MNQLTRRGVRALVGLVLMPALIGCVEDTGPDADACEAPTATVELALGPEALTPNDPAVCRDQEVTLVISSEVDGVFHIHGYDDQLPAAQVAAGEETRLEFTASRSGQFPIELHPQDDPAGVELGVFTVHEP